MKIRLITIGKLKEKYLREGIEEYRKRLRALQVDLEVVELPEASGESTKCIEQESTKILTKIRGNFVAFDRTGELVTSEDLAQIIKQNEKTGQLDFVIGGSHGLSQELLSQAKNVISFGKITYPHQLFRLLASEQIYRGVSINRGKPYHK